MTSEQVEDRPKRQRRSKGPPKDPVTFIRVFMEGLTTGRDQNWVADQLECTRDAVSQRASSMRQRGVKLPHWPRMAPRKQDVGELNAYIAQWGWPH